MVVCIAKPSDGMPVVPEVYMSIARSLAKSMWQEPQLVQLAA